MRQTSSPNMKIGKAQSSWASSTHRSSKMAAPLWGYHKWSRVGLSQQHTGMGQHGRAEGPHKVDTAPLYFGHLWHPQSHIVSLQKEQNQAPVHEVRVTSCTCTPWICYAPVLMKLMSCIRPGGKGTLCFSTNEKEEKKKKAKKVKMKEKRQKKRRKFPCSLHI